MHGIRFLTEKYRLRGAARLKTNQVNAYTKALGDLHRYAHIAVTGYHCCITDGLIPRQIYQVGYKEGVYLLLLAATVDRPEPEFDVLHVCKRHMVESWSVSGTVIPIDAKNRNAGAPAHSQGF